MIAARSRSEDEFFAIRRFVGKCPTGSASRQARPDLFARSHILGEGALSIDCTIVQLSPTGARLSVPASVALPDRFELAIPQRSLRRRAKLVWRKGNQAGVEFEQPDKPTSAPAAGEDHLARIRDLEAANAKLRAQVAELLVRVERLTEP
jgi:hypothetical protein